MRRRRDSRPRRHRLRATRLPDIPLRARHRDTRRPDTPATGYPPAGYPPGAWPGYGQRSRTNGFAVASLVLSLVGWLPCGIGSVLAIIFGFVAKEQIKRSQGREHGSGLANAGIIIGFVAIALWLVFFVVSLGHSGSGA